MKNQVDAIRQVSDNDGVAHFLKSSYNLIVGALPDVTDGFITNVLNIANKILNNKKI